MSFARLSVASILLSALLGVLPTAAAEAMGTLRIEVPRDLDRVAIENLAGTFRIVPGSGDTVVAVATVRAETKALLDSVRFERVNEGGRPAFRVRYPYDEVRAFRCPKAEDDGTPGWLASLLGGSSTTTTYDDHQVKISSSTGTLLCADVEVQVPRRALDIAFRNVAGRLDAREIEGTLSFGTASGRITLERVKGEVKADTGSGDVEANDLEGEYSCETGSGDCTVRGFRGERVACSTGSGDVRIESATAKKISARTGSGDVHLLGADAEELMADTGSGDVEIAVRAGSPSRISAQTGSGDVLLKLPLDASFEAMADQGSGEIANRFADATPILKEREVVGYRRGDGRTRIAVDTGSGDLVLEPL
jgi:DUF4097 and DUF4098 domain-containing protein YvlB